jgi:HAD superfamily hydrolase (TIGR01490 family)
MFRQRYFDVRDIVRLASDQLAYRVVGTEAEGRMTRAREASLEAIRGRRREDVVAVGRSVASEEIIPRLYPQAVELLNRHKRAGREVYICSSSPQDFLELLADELRIDGVVGTCAEVAGDRYTGRLEGLLCHGPEKARRVRELAEQRNIDLTRSYAYSDSANDLPLLEAVGNPVAMNPDRSLLIHARRQGWQVLDFRVARRRTLVASVAGAGAAAAAGAGYAVGYLMGRSKATRQPV